MIPHFKFCQGTWYFRITLCGRMFPTDWFHHPNVFDSRATTTDALLPPRYVHFVIERPTGSFPICWARAIGLVQRHVSVEGKRQERIERPEPNCHWSKLVRSLTFRTQTKFKSERKFWHTLACCCTYHRRYLLEFDQLQLSTICLYRLETNKVTRRNNIAASYKKR